MKSAVETGSISRRSRPRVRRWMRASMRRLHHSISPMRCPDVKRPRRTWPSALEARERSVDQVARKRQPFGEGGRGHRTGRFEPAAQRFGDGGLLLVACAEVRRARHAGRLGGGPQNSVAIVERDHATRGGQLVEPMPATPPRAAA